MQDLGGAFFDKLRVSASADNHVWKSLRPKVMSNLDHARMTMILKHAEELYVEPIGRGVHRPYKVRLKTGECIGEVDCAKAVLKTIHCQYETKRYCASMDARVTGPERELLAYDLDRVMGFDLVPPTAGREVQKLGYGSVQAWVKAPLAVEWIKKGYDYKKHSENPWFHRLAAFDFVCGGIDRHAANWIMDKAGRVYAIDNGYQFVKGDDRRFFKSNVGKSLVGKMVHPMVRSEVLQIDARQVAETLKNRGFQCGEEEGVLKRLNQLKRLEVWEVMGGLWDPAK